MFLVGHTNLGLIGGAVFTLLLLVAAVRDFQTRRIPNRLVGLIAVLGLTWSVLVTPGLPGAFNGMGGLLTGLICWLPFYAIGWLGAGDVKLLQRPAVGWGRSAQLKER